MNALADLLLVLAVAAVFMGGILLAELGRAFLQHRRQRQIDRRLHGGA